MTPFSFDRVVLFGASILSSLHGEMQNYLLHQHGLDVPVQNSSLGGRTPADGADAIDAVIASVPEGEHAVFAVHLGGNGLAGIMSPDSVANREQFLVSMEFIYDAITTAGHTCIVTPISFRAIDGTYGGNSYDDPYAYGSERINIDLLIPLQAVKFPDQIGANGRPYWDMHNRIYNDGPLVFNVDGQHLNRTTGVSRWIADTIVSLSMIGTAPPITRFADPRVVVRTPASINLNFTAFTSPKCEVRGQNRIIASPGTYEVTDYDNNPSGMVLTHAGSSANDGGFGGTTVGLDYLAPAQTVSTHFAYGGETKTYTLTGAPKNTPATIKIASSRFTVDTRVTSFTVDGVVAGSVNSASQTEAPSISYDFVTSSSGEIVISKTGTTFNYINSAEIDFTYPSTAPTGQSSNNLTLGLYIGL